MTTLIVCIKRNPALSAAEFSHHWREKHAPLVAACGDFTRHLTRYTQHHMADGPAAALFGVSGDFDGIAELAFLSTAHMAQAFAEPAYLADVRPDEANFIDADRCQSFLTHSFDVLPRQDLFAVAGKTAVVTGGAKGVGAMISRALVAAGARVIVVSRDAAQGAAFVSALDGPGEAVFIAGDLADMEGVRRAASAIGALAPDLHILVNNAGMFSAAPIAEADAARWDQEMGLNLRAPFFLAQALLQNLQNAARDGDPARIINIGSIGALWGKSSNGAYGYGAGKAAVHHLTRMMASDLTATGITVNAIAPGFFPSDMTEGFFAAVPGLKDQVIAGIPAGRLGHADDIGGAVIFLCSRAGAYVSGTVLPVEGALWQA